MLISSSKLGGIPGLSWLWDRSPLWAALVVFIADFGIMMLLMLAEGLPPWRRKQYVTVVWNDMFFYPVYAAMVVVVLRTSGPLHGFFTSRGWHVGILITGFAISILCEWIGVRVDQYTMSQEMSPSKLWHTFIFGVMFYWLVSTLPAVLVVHQPLWAMVVVIACIVGALVTMVVELVSPLPPNAHLEGSWRTWKWYIRTIGT